MRSELGAHDLCGNPWWFLPISAWLASRGRWLSTAVGSAGIVGGSLMLVRDGRILARQNQGYQDLDRKVPVDDKTIYHWASITKTFTGIAIMQLRDRGLLSLDDPVVKYVPELGPRHDPFGDVSAFDDSPPHVAQCRLSRRHLAVGRRQTVAPVRADQMGTAGCDAALHQRPIRPGQASTATPTQA